MNPYKGIDVGTEVGFMIGDTEYSGKITEATRSPAYNEAKDSFLVMAEGQEASSYVKASKLFIYAEADKADDKDDEDDEKAADKDDKKDKDKKDESIDEAKDKDDKSDDKKDDSKDKDKDDDDKDDKKDESKDKDKDDDKDDSKDEKKDDSKDDDKEDEKKKKSESIEAPSQNETTDTKLDEQKLDEARGPEFVINYVSGMDSVTVTLNSRNSKKIAGVRKEAFKLLKASNPNASDDFWIDGIWSETHEVENVDWMSVLAPGGVLNQDMVNKVFESPEESAIKLSILGEYFNNLSAKIIEDNWDSIELYDAANEDWVGGSFGSSYPELWLETFAETNSELSPISAVLTGTSYYSCFDWARAVSEVEINGAFSSGQFGDYFATWNPKM